MLQGRLAAGAAWLARLVVAGAFIVAALLKLRDPATFAEQIGNYQLMSELSNLVAIVLPCIELTAAVSLLVGPLHFRRAGALVIATLLLSFTGALARAWAIGIDLECGCFGLGSTNIGIWPILRNLGLLTVLAVGIWLELPEARPQPSGAS